MHLFKESLRLRQDGAAMVFGIFFAVLLAGCVFRLYALAEVILYRQHVQDAADSAAFAAAVVNARGMNLVALINMTMAAALSVLVALRIAQTLCFVGIGICFLLAWPTWGASLGGIPPLTEAENTVQDLASGVRDVLPEILSALHTAGKAISVVVPLGSNAAVIDLARAQYGAKIGLAIPGRLSLPVEDGSFNDLCRHAGELAGDLALLPLKKGIPPKVMHMLSSATGKLANAGSGWFCGEKGAEPPDLNQDQKYDPLTLPVLPKQNECEQVRRVIADPDDPRVTDACNAAAVEALASMPGQNGQARAGEPLCPSDCKEQPRASCPPPGVDLCTPHEAADIEEQARKAGVDVDVTDGPGTPYRERLELARGQCDPTAAHPYPLGGVWSLERYVTRAYQWVPTGGAGGSYTVEDLTPSQSELVRRDDDDRSLPCGPHGKVGERYLSDPSQPVCEGPPVCSDQQGTPLGLDLPCSPGPKRYYQRFRQVLDILRCAELKPHDKAPPPKVNLDQEVNSKAGKKQNTSPFQLAKDVWLGGSDFQLRSVIFARDTKWAGREILHRIAPDEKPSELARLARGAGKIAFAQAEYYFDFSGEFEKLSDQRDPKSVVEWMWNQGWVARLRPFRIRHADADGPRKSATSLDDEQLSFVPADKRQAPKQALSCPHGESCEGVGKVLSALGDGSE